MTPAQQALVDRLFPCPVCGRAMQVVVEFKWRNLGLSLYLEHLKEIVDNCPLCAAGRPDLWVAGRKWLKERGYEIVQHWRAYLFGTNIVVSFQKRTENDQTMPGTLDGRGSTDIAALLDVIGQVEREGE